MSSRLYVAIALLSGLVVCTHTLETSGVTETGTVVKGKLVTQSGIPVSSSTVKLVPAGFDPLRDGRRLQVYVDTTDIAGLYTFNDVPAGAYTLQAVNNGEKTRVMTGIIYFSEDSAGSA